MAFASDSEIDDFAAADSGDGVEVHSPIRALSKGLVQAIDKSGGVAEANADANAVTSGAATPTEETATASRSRNVTNLVDESCGEISPTHGLSLGLALGGSPCIVTPLPLKNDDMNTPDPMPMSAVLKLAMVPRTIKFDESIVRSACERSFDVAEHPGEIALPLWNLESCNYWKRFYDDFAMDSKLELGRQRRAWNVLSGCTGTFSEGAIFEVFTTDYHN